LTLRERNRVQILLRSDAASTDEEIADDLGVRVATVVNVRKRFAAEGLEASLAERPRAGGPAKFDGEAEATVVALALARARRSRRVDRRVDRRPRGRVALRRVDLGTHRRAGAQKNKPEPWQEQSWCLPGGVSGEFVGAMEDVLELYAEADDPKQPRVNFGECSVEMHEDFRYPPPVDPGRPARIDDEYEWNGTANLFIIIDPNAGRRVTVTGRRAKKDFAAE